MALETIVVSTSTTSSSRVGDADANKYQAQQVVSVHSGTVDSVDVTFGVTDGTPVDDIIVDIYADTTDSPSGSSLASATITNPSASTLYTATFGSPASITGSTKFWVVFHRSDVSNASNFRRIARDNTAGYASGLQKVGDATPTWTLPAAGPFDLTITVYVTYSVPAGPSLLLMGV